MLGMANLGYPLHALGFQKVLALMASTAAAATAITYDSSMRRFVTVVREQARAVQVDIKISDLLPAGPMEPIPEGFVLAFMAAAVGKFKTGTIEGTLSAIAKWHEVKSAGRLPSPTHAYNVKLAIDAMRRIHGGTVFGVPRAAFALPVILVRYLVDTALRLSAEARSAGKHNHAYGFARDALFYTVTFLAALRKEEAAALKWEDLRSHADPGVVTIWIAKSKVDQFAVGVGLPVAWNCSSGLSLQRAVNTLTATEKKLGRAHRGYIFGQQTNPDVN